MKKLFIILCLCLVSVGLFAAENYEPGTTLYVSVKSVKSGKTEFLYGDKVIVDQMSGKKVLVHLYSDSDVSGWISAGSVTKKKIIKNSDGATVNATSEELSLAGKGFSETAENLFKADNPNLDFTLVDQIETITVSEDDLNAFIEEGQLCSN